MPIITTSIIVPCYNEIDGLPQLVRRISAMRDAGRIPNWDLYLIDDGSTDGTKAAIDRLAAEHPDWIRAVHHEKNKGLGASIRTGFTATTAPFVCTMDSDCTFAPETLPQMIEMLHAGADLVTASPWHPASSQGTVHPVRKILSQSTSWVYRRILGDKVHSFTPMHRAYRREVIKKVVFHSNNFSGVAEFLVRAIFLGFRVKELPMPVDRRQFGESKINVFQSVKSHLSLMRLAGWTSLSMWADAKFAGGRLVIEE